MYRPEWFTKIAANRSILDIALDVHMTSTGAAERSSKEQVNDLRCLAHVITNWKTPQRIFDAAVHGVLTAAVDEAAHSHKALT